MPPVKDWRGLVLKLVVFAIPALFILRLCTACATPLDPIQRPPEQFRKGTVATIEFVAHPEIRCAQRGAIFAAACSEGCLITIGLPSEAIAPSQYVARLEHELAHCEGWPPTHGVS